jgi:DNA-binding NtrC family response regulator
MTGINSLSAYDMPVAAAKPAGDDAIHIINPEGPGQLIMFVDDDEMVIGLVQRLLTDEGYRLITALNGLQAMDIYRRINTKLQLVILDFVMPIMNGSDLFMRMHRMNPSVPIVLTSGYAEHDKFKSLFADGLCGFIQKPMTRQKLLLQVRSVLNSGD